MAKLQQKIRLFQDFRRCKGLCAVRSYLQTAQKHGLEGLDVLCAALQGHPLSGTDGHLAAVKWPWSPGAPKEVV